MENIVLSQKLQKYMDQASEDLKLTQMNIKDKALLRSSYGAKWCRYNFQQQKIIKQLNKNIDDLKNEIKKQLYERQKKLISSGDKNRQTYINVNAEKILQTTPEYIALKEQIKNQEEIIKLIDETQKLISQFGYDIKNAIEILKMENSI